MKKETVEKKFKKSRGKNRAWLIGDVETRENYYPAIVRYDEKKQIVTYNYHKLVECFAEQYFADTEYHNKICKLGTYSWDDAMFDAATWIDYNIPCYGEHAPKISGIGV